MARYLAHADTWISHECRLVKAGEEFEAEFPKHMELGKNLELVKPEKAKKDGKPDGELV